jgi:hypothetical protein
MKFVGQRYVDEKDELSTSWDYERFFKSESQGRPCLNLHMGQADDAVVEEGTSHMELVIEYPWIDIGLEGEMRKKLFIANRNELYINDKTPLFEFETMKSLSTIKHRFNVFNYWQSIRDMDRNERVIKTCEFDTKRFNRSTILKIKRNLGILKGDELSDRDMIDWL